jgi:hypothetical protein
MSDKDKDSRPGVEADAPPMGRIYGMVGGLVIVVALIVIGLWQLFKQTIRSEIYDKELSLESKELAEVRARDEERLTRYAIADEKRGFHQIPIERAMDRLLRHPELIQDIPLAKPQPATLPATRPARPAPKPPAPRPPEEKAASKKPPKPALPPSDETKAGEAAPTDHKDNE